MYKAAVQRMVLQETPNLELHEGLAEDVILREHDAGHGHAVQGVLTSVGDVIPCKAVVLTTGTFLRGVIHVGNK